LLSNLVDRSHNNLLANLLVNSLRVKSPLALRSQQREQEGDPLGDPNRLPLR